MKRVQYVAQCVLGTLCGTLRGMCGADAGWLAINYQSLKRVRGAAAAVGGERHRGAQLGRRGAQFRRWGAQLGRADAWLRQAPSARPGYTGTSLIRNSDPLGPYSRTMPRVLCWS